MERVNEKDQLQNGINSDTTAGEETGSWGGTDDGTGSARIGQRQHAHHHLSATACY
jgi:hypothetical protein